MLERVWGLGGDAPAAIEWAADHGAPQDMSPVEWPVPKGVPADRWATLMDKTLEKGEPPKHLPKAVDAKSLTDAVANVQAQRVVALAAKPGEAQRVKRENNRKNARIGVYLLVWLEPQTAEAASA